jgi:hypothetical protein
MAEREGFGSCPIVDGAQVIDSTFLSVFLFPQIPAGFAILSYVKESRWSFRRVAPSPAAQRQAGFAGAPIIGTVAGNSEKSTKRLLTQSWSGRCLNSGSDLLRVKQISFTCHLVKSMA